VSSDDIFWANISELTEAYRRRTVSPVEVTQALLSRVERLNPTLNAFLSLTPERALEQARRAEAEISRAERRGSLHGVPVSVKDLFLTRGIETTAGSLLYRGWKPDFDATVVSRLREAGAVVIGKTHMHELAYGITNNNPHYGPCRNPWDTERIPGGSSGGSAVAVAAGLSYASFGTDTGGSIRIPASYCGVVGLKPTYGRISRHGVIPLSFQLDHVGPFARSVSDAVMAAEAVAGFDVSDPSSLPDPPPVWHRELKASISEWKIGLVRGSFVSRLQPEVQAGVDRAASTLETAGARVEEIEIPNAVEIGEIAHLVQMADGAALYQEQIRQRPEQFGEDVRLLIEQGHFVTAVDYINGQRLRRRFQQELDRLFERVRALLLPATPITAPRLDEQDVHVGGEDEAVGMASTRLVRPFNFAGVPVLTVPCGFSNEGLPLAMQIVARAGDELTALRLGNVYQELTDWHTRRPKL
jgi:aspartyl-tRNA(Asn)/glutamyl-tRNA(Gln) amidotransferase subunit A